MRTQRHCSIGRLRRLHTRRFCRRIRSSARFRFSLSSAVDYVTLQPKESLTVYLPSDVDLKTDITIHYTTLYGTLAAPVKSGDIAGQVTVMYNDEILGTVDLITTAEIPPERIPLYAVAD